MWESWALDKSVNLCQIILAAYLLLKWDFPRMYTSLILCINLLSLEQDGKADPVPLNFEEPIYVLKHGKINLLYPDNMLRIHPNFLCVTGHAEQGGLWFLI